MHLHKRRHKLIGAGFAPPLPYGGVILGANGAGQRKMPKIASGIRKRRMRRGAGIFDSIKSGFNRFRNSSIGKKIISAGKQVVKDKVIPMARKKALDYINTKVQNDNVKGILTSGVNKLGQAATKQLGSGLRFRRKRRKARMWKQRGGDITSNNQVRLI